VYLDAIGLNAGAVVNCAIYAKFLGWEHARIKMGTHLLTLLPLCAIKADATADSKLKNKINLHIT
jgi:hypothetical protein